MPKMNAKKPQSVRASAKLAARRAHYGGPIYLDIKQDAKGRWGFTIRSTTNGQVLANDANQRYSRKIDCAKTLWNLADRLPSLLSANS